MRKQYVIENLDCAHCAMKMEDAAKKVKGVTFVSVNFLSMKLTLEAEDRAFSTVLRQVQKACKEVEPDVKFHENKYKMTSNEKSEIVRIAVSVLLFLAANLLEVFEVFKEGSLLLLIAFLPSYFLAGFDVIRKAFLGLFHGKVFDENFLMTLATFGAFAIGEGGEGVMVMLLYCIGEFFQELAVSKSRQNISQLMNIRPDSANLIDNGQERRVQPEDVSVGSLIRIKPGEKIPLDGVVVEGSSFLDTAALTGESVPLKVGAGDQITSGCVNMNGLLTVKTEKSFGESSVSKILSLIEDSGDGKSHAERFISRFARYYTPVVVILAMVLAVIPPLFSGNWGFWIHKAVTCLVISCPCALVISVPLSFFGGIGGASSQGILIKGAEVLEKLAKAGLCAFDKTGTLTQGQFKVTAIHPEIISQEELLELAATCENYSDHPISLSLKAAFNREIDKGRIGKIEENPGEGVVAVIDGNEYFVGNEKLMRKCGIALHPCARCHHSGTVVHVANREQYLGHIVISDQLRPDAKKAIEDLKALGVKKTALLSGDQEEVAKEIGQQLGIQDCYAKLLPQDKLAVIQELSLQKQAEETLLFVGDGINDTPVLFHADVGIAMGGIGADAAVEAADVVLIDDRPSKVALAIQIAKKTLSIVWQNIILSVGIKLFVLIPNIFLGQASVPIGLAIFADTGVCILAVLNAARALRIKKL